MKILNWKKIGYFLLIFCIFCSWSQISTAQTQDVVKTKLQGDETLRSLAKKYFDEPNDWEVILRYNGFKSVNEISDNTVFNIPVKLYSTIVRKNDSALKSIDDANREGAGILAKDMIDKAVELQKQAIELKKNGQLDQAEKTITESLANANKALQAARDKRIKSITAILSDKRGKVQSRSQEQTIWYDAVLSQELKEKERIRTLENSGGAISLIDGSKLTLGENALAVIEAMKQDVVKNTNSSNVVLLQGDVMAFLSSQSKKNAVNVSTPGVETDIRSRNFRASRDADNTTRFANYEGEIDIKAEGASVTIKQNEGTKIAAGQKPSGPVKLIPPPIIQTPQNTTKIYTMTVIIKWENVPNAIGYRIEIAPNRNFTDIVYTGDVRNAVNMHWTSQANGVFYLRIASIDKDNFVGPSSEPIEYYVEADQLPPYLMVDSPQEGETSFTGDITVSGMTEKGARVMVENDSIKVDAEGKFKAKYKIPGNLRKINIKAIDRAGNISNLTRTVNCNLGDQLIYLDVATEQIINRNEVAVTGRVQPMTTLQINGQAVTLSDNQFNQLLTLKEGINQVTLTAKTTSGKSQNAVLSILVDKTPPVMELDEIPSFTKDASVQLTGTLSEKGIISVNDRQFRIEGAIAIDLQLEEGDNTLTIVATDQAGNQSISKVEVLRDTHGPDLTPPKITPTEVKGGELIKVTVTATDRGVGLSRNGKFSVEINPGGKILSGILSLGAGGDYAGNVMVMPGIKGQVKLKELRVSDYLGNETVINK
ncbi:MAG: FecR domain-containing protein [Candidatus Neomarinimicrobiota bacterium]